MLHLEVILHVIALRKSRVASCREILPRERLVEVVEADGIIRGRRAGRYTGIARHKTLAAKISGWDDGAARIEHYVLAGGFEVVTEDQPRPGSVIEVDRLPRCPKCSKTLGFRLRR